MKLYIVGSVASGKSTLARKISRAANVPCYHLDELVHVPDAGSAWGNKKRPAEERDSLFRAILRSESYIIEDTGRACFAEGMKRADTILLLEIPLAVRYKRILLRWIKQKTGAEKCIYKPRLEMLKSMFQWAKNYDTGADGTKARVAAFAGKTVRLCSNRQIEAYMRTLG